MNNGLTKLFSLLGISKKKNAPTKLILWTEASREQQEAEMARLNIVFHKTGKCPDCRKGDLISGPEGGCAINVHCEMCGSWFNSAYTGYDVILTERIRISEMSTAPTLLAGA